MILMPYQQTNDSQHTQEAVIRCLYDGNGHQPSSDGSGDSPLLMNQSAPSSPENELTLYITPAAKKVVSGQSTPLGISEGHDKASPPLSRPSVRFEGEMRGFPPPHLRLNPAPITIRIKSTRMIPIKGAPDIEGMLEVASRVSITKPDTSS